MTLAVEYGSVEVIVAAAIAALASVLVSMIQHRKTRRVNTNEHGATTEILTEIRDEQRAMRHEQSGMRSDIREVRQSVRKIDQRVEKLEHS